MSIKRTTNNVVLFEIFTFYVKYIKIINQKKKNLLKENVTQFCYISNIIL